GGWARSSTRGRRGCLRAFSFCIDDLHLNRRLGGVHRAENPCAGESDEFATRHLEGPHFTRFFNREIGRLLASLELSAGNFPALYLHSSTFTPAGLSHPHRVSVSELPAVYIHEQERLTRADFGAAEIERIVHGGADILSVSGFERDFL